MTLPHRRAIVAAGASVLLGLAAVTVLPAQHAPAATSAPAPAGRVAGVPAGRSATAQLGTVQLDTALVAGRPTAVTVPSSIVNQRLSWSECFPGKGYTQLTCALMRVPKDWNRPSAGTLGVVVSRVRAADQAKRRGVLFTNPGGPGEPGVTLPLYLSTSEKDVAAAYDLVGMDPRGTGNSSPLRCANPSYLTRAMALDGRNTSSANQARITSLTKAFAKECAGYGATKYVTTYQTVRDINLLRSLLGVAKISYVGYSAGTWLGAWYATTFPSRVDRFVFDGNLDFTAPLYRSFSRQPAGFQASFERYFQPWTAKYDSALHLGATQAAVKATYERRRAALAKAPLRLADGSLLTAAGYDAGIASALYWTGNYPDLGAALSALEHWGQAGDDEKQLVSDLFGTGSGSTAPTDAFWAITCQDTANPTPATLAADTARFRSTAPLVGANWNIDPCTYWSTKPVGAPMTGKGMPPVLMVNNAADPATPLANARAARARTANARLVTVAGQPDHTIYGEGAPCVEGIVNDWLLRGTLPSSDTVCPGLALPDPTAAPEQPAATAGSSAAAALPRAGTRVSSSLLLSARSLSSVPSSGPLSSVPSPAPAGVWMSRLADRLGEPALAAAAG